MEEIKSFLVGFIVKWLLQIGGTFFLTIGVQQQTIEEIIGGLVAILSGIVVSLIQHKKAINTPVPLK